MTDPVALITSVLALAISATTAWLTLFRRGTVRMTQPTVIFFGAEMPRARREHPWPKVYLRSLLFSTSKRGRVIENMYVSISRNESHQNFNIWVHGDDKLVRGSGLFVGETGVAASHHFPTPQEDSSFRFLAGRYRLTIHAHLLGDKQSILLFHQELEISTELATLLKEPGTGIYFDWGPDSSRYIPHAEKRAPVPDPEKLLEVLALSGISRMKNDAKDSPEG
jgi:hypothetical protein